MPATVRLFGLPKVALGERHITFRGGLKGGLAIAIVLSLQRIRSHDVLQMAQQ